MELRGVDELMDLLGACRGVGRPDTPVDLHEHSLQTAALLRRGRPADKELQIAGLVHDIGHVLRPGTPHGSPELHGSRGTQGTHEHADLGADAVRPLLGERVSRLVRLHTHPRPAGPGPLADDALTLRQAHETARVPGLDAGVLEDWRTLLELLAARRSRTGAVD
ncbi:HD domain-containing protein [Streptomyces sp. NPDC093094]|uniref:HD domain-containing protein n=1 Tax=Streptomyces sp. NPDC093094 TaxID=3366026 RepID=UPI0037F3D005